MQTSQLAELPQSSDDDDDISLLGGADDPVAKHDTEEWCKPSAFSHCVRHLAFLWNLLFLLLGRTGPCWPVAAGSTSCRKGASCRTPLVHSGQN